MRARTPTPGGALLCPHIADLGHEDGACSECYGEAVRLLAAERSALARLRGALREWVEARRALREWLFDKSTPRDDAETDRRYARVDAAEAAALRALAGKEAP